MESEKRGKEGQGQMKELEKTTKKKCKTDRKKEKKNETKKQLTNKQTKKEKKRKRRIENEQKVLLPWVRTALQAAIFPTYL